MGKTKRKSIHLVGGSSVAAAKPRKRKLSMRAKSRRAGASIKAKVRGSARSAR